MEFIQDGDLAMVSRGPHSNSSTFLITFCPLPILNKQHVVIGTVLKGMRVIRRIEDVGTKNGVPLEPVRIIGCGLYRGPQDGPPFFSSADLLDKAEEPVLEEKSFLELPAEKQEELLQKIAAAKGPHKKGGPPAAYSKAAATAPAAATAAAEPVAAGGNS
ncbi:cyclophilin, putative [Eimeria tenella]|uniref:Cyclophilin, putative n=1 Tax=Eimeria tenella TaxID=5802 RepID=U6KZS6_EIMTE|nr:cyclophilin, putative [Eimeria tenella]CDJ43441.1 cyclophilin, putative [Eimeria tenella]|eukprot:XP_013234191.1 cyclophilin, putative [Eimeria tenella]